MLKRHALLTAMVSMMIDAHAGAEPAKNGSTSSSSADVWEIPFNRYAKTNIPAGENGGRVLESINKASIT